MSDTTDHVTIQTQRDSFRKNVRIYDLACRLTANGRVDTAPTIYRGLCLFGAKSGWAYCLRADDGRMVWQRRVAPLAEQIMAD